MYLLGELERKVWTPVGHDRLRHHPWARLFPHGTQSHGVILATGALVGSIGAAIGPIVTGSIFDALGSYTVAFVICAALAFTGLVSTFLLPKRP